MKMNFKKLTAALAALSVAVCMTGCGGEKDSAKEAENSTVDSKLVGEWFYEEAGINMMFSEDNTVAATMDYTGIMYFDADKNLVIGGTAVPADYDGSKLSVTVDGTDMFVRERKGEADADSLDGTYYLTGGELYTEMAEVYDGTVTGETMQMVVDGENLKIVMEFASYEADGSKIVFSDTKANMLGIEDTADYTCDYVIDGTTVTFTVESDGSTMVMEKVG